MRQVDSLLIKAGRSGSLAPAVKVAIGDITFYNNEVEGMQTCRNTDTGQEWSTRHGNRIELVQTYEQPYGGSLSQKSKIILNNADNFLTDIDFKGGRVSIGWGAYTTKGRLYDNPPPFYVREQVKSEQPGAQKVTLTLLGLTDWLAQDYAQCDYISNGTDTLYDLFVKVIGATIPPFTGCKAFNVIIDTDFDGVFDVVIPGPSFKIRQGKDTRATVLARIFELTYVKMKAGNEALIDSKDSVHLFVPTPDITNTISLDETDHKYFVNSVYSSIFAPNKIVIQNPNNEGTVYTGFAKDYVSYEAIPTERTEYISGLTSNAQASLVASTMLQNLKSYHNGFSAKIPMCFGLDLFDKPNLESPRTGESYTGNLGVIQRVYNPRKGEPQYYMEIQAGKWLDPRASWDVMGIGAGFVDTDDENLYASIFVPCRAYHTISGMAEAYSTLFTGLYSIANGAYAIYKVKVPSGSFKLRCFLLAGVGCGIIKVYLDSILALTQDCYSSGVSYIQLDNSITVPSAASDWHDLKVKVDGKNESSSGYIAGFNDMVLHPY